MQGLAGFAGNHILASGIVLGCEYTVQAHEDELGLFQEMTPGHQNYTDRRVEHFRPWWDDPGG